MDAFLYLKGLVTDGRDWKEASEDDPGSLDEGLTAATLRARAGGSAAV